MSAITNRVDLAVVPGCTSAVPRSITNGPTGFHEVWRNTFRGVKQSLSVTGRSGNVVDMEPEAYDWMTFISGPMVSVDGSSVCGASWSTRVCLRLISLSSYL